MRLSTAALAATLLFMAAPASGQPAEELVERLPTLIEEAVVPGLSMAWLEDGRVVWTGEFGVTRVGAGDSVTPETVFEAASLSKPVVAYATLRLVARGELALDDPLWDAAGYERLAHDERAREITARMVLTHTTGLPNWGGTPLELNFSPGSSWNYSGEGFVYLATMLERRTGLSLGELVQQEVFSPLGMEHSSFVWRPDFDRAAASPHDLIGRPGEKYKPQEPNAAASLHTTALDYGRFLSAVMRGEGLPAELADEMLAPRAAVQGWGSEEARTDLSWGLGWGLERGERGEAIWHWGDNGNFRCFVIAYPESGEGLVYFTNSNNGLSIAETIVGSSFGDDHASLRYLDYGTWDSPRRQARIGLRKDFTSGDESGGWGRLERLPSELTPDIAERETRGLGEFLVGDGNEALGLSVLEWGAARYGSASSHRALGDALTEAGRHEAALSAYEAAVEADPELASELEPRMGWLREGITASAAPFRLEEDRLYQYVGSYGPRSILRDGDRLLYSREGAGTEIVLVPLAPDLFGLEGNTTFRIRFERSPEGRISAILGLYSDGRTDRTERDPG